MHVASSLHTAHKPGLNLKIFRAVEGEILEDRRNGVKSTIIAIARTKNNGKDTVRIPNCVCFLHHRAIMLLPLRFRLFFSFVFDIFHSCRRCHYCIFLLYFPFPFFKCLCRSLHPESPSRREGSRRTLVVRRCK